MRQYCGNITSGLLLSSVTIGFSKYACNFYAPTYPTLVFGAIKISGKEVVIFGGTLAEWALKVDPSFN